MNGSIMGMTKREITGKLDEIVEFAGVARYLDTPVKRYSSGMTVRLGFAIAAHLDPEILVVDEVLAVGDAEFQKKAIGKMQDVSRGEGRTVLFVSHNMTAVKNLCKIGILLKDGFIAMSDNVDNIINEYTIDNEKNIAANLHVIRNRKGNGLAIFSDFYITTLKGEEIFSILTGQDIIFNFKIYAKKKCKKVDLGFSFLTTDGVMISNLYANYQNMQFELHEGYSIISCHVKDFPFCSPKLIVRGMLYVDGELSDWPSTHLGMINIEKGDYYQTGKNSSNDIQFLFKGKWSL
jgi:lipopolysaccharide transport system ATP-binding protein